LEKKKKNGASVPICTLAEKEEISSVFLEQIFFKLRKAGLVSSIRGPGGGFKFNFPTDKITVKQIFDAAGEETELGFCDKSMENCKNLGDCMTHHALSEATKLMNTYLSELTLAAILERYGNIPVPKG
jgi:Rrf2 family iron-sulfur cluster assembly transcriptional regulator